MISELKFITIFACEFSNTIVVIYIYHDNFRNKS